MPLPSWAAWGGRPPGQNAGHLGSAQLISGFITLQMLVNCRLRHASHGQASLSIPCLLARRETSQTREPTARTQVCPGGAVPDSALGGVSWGGCLLGGVSCQSRPPLRPGGCLLGTRPSPLPPASSRPGAPPAAPGQSCPPPGRGKDCGVSFYRRERLRGRGRREIRTGVRFGT